MTDKREKKAELNIPGYISEVKVDDNLLDDRVADSIGRRGLLVFAENRLDGEKSKLNILGLVWKSFQVNMYTA